MAALAEALAFFAPDIEVELFPAWDCLPYDRVSPNGDISARRMATLSRLATRLETGGDKPIVVLLTVNGALQRVPARETVGTAAWSAHVDNRVDLDALTAYLATNGYNRTGTVRERGEFAVRGGIVDIFPPGFELPLRLDMFGDTLDAVRSFDPESQRTVGQLSGVDLVPAGEIHLDENTIRRFRAGYVAALGAVNDGDPLYAAVSEGRKHAGMEHWLPLFHEKLETIFDYMPGATITLDAQADEAKSARLDLIRDYYEARVAAREGRSTVEAPSYKPLKPELLYLDAAEWDAILDTQPVRVFTPFRVPEESGINLGGKLGATLRRNVRRTASISLRCWVGILPGYVVPANASPLQAGAKGADRLVHVLADHGIGNVLVAEKWADINSVIKSTVSLIVLGLEAGFETDDLAVISEQDVLGDRLVRQRRKKRAENFLTEASSLSPGDFVVHVDHGIGRFERLQTIEVMGAPHDCLLLLYQCNDKLYLPVENIELLSRYGSMKRRHSLTGWAAPAGKRKARLKERIREMAGELIKIAAARELKKAPVMEPQPGAYDEFCARFPFTETDDQEQAIEAVLEDLGADGRWIG